MQGLKQSLSKSDYIAIGTSFAAAAIGSDFHSAMLKIAEKTMSADSIEEALNMALLSDRNLTENRAKRDGFNERERRKKRRGFACGFDKRLHIKSARVNAKRY
ncbi:MAG: hypothetical protein LBQ52_02215 [Helicobacteraceae bacterium]|nr:hypothetical protein [Helicobacteraceae bacterium]